MQTELALAQSPLEVSHPLLRCSFRAVCKCVAPLKGPHGADHQSANASFASPLDETLDKEVLLLLQGPSPEHMAREFRRLVDTMVTLLL